MGIKITESEIKLYKENIPCECENCNKIFGISKSDAYRVFKGTKNKRFCSRSCLGEYKTKTQRKEVCCKNCGKAFMKHLSAISDNNFCSKSCAGTFNGKVHPKRTKKIRNVINCETCKSPIKDANKKYCSLSCFYKHIKETNIKQWTDGKLAATTGRTLNIRQFVRNFLIEQAGNKCSKCGWNVIHSVTKRCPLEINHIDGNPSNNDISNLEVLCPNCHSLTPNFRALNKNSPRKRK